MKKTVEELMADVPIGGDRWVCERECSDFWRLGCDTEQHYRVEDAEPYGKPGRWRVHGCSPGGGWETHIDKIGDHERDEAMSGMARELELMADRSRSLRIGGSVPLELLHLARVIRAFIKGEPT